MADDANRIGELERRLVALERALEGEAASIRAELRALRGEAEQPLPVDTLRLAPPPRAAAPGGTPAPREIHRTRRASVDLKALTEARGLAIAGGIVTVLGFALVFVLAVDRGWIGPSVRCLLGGGLSLALAAAAIEIRRRYGALVASLGACGTAVAGCYLTLYAASRGYHLIGTAIVWPAAVVVAAGAVAFAWAWSSELLASLGLVTMVVAPLAIEGHLNGAGVGASTVAAAAALGLGALRRWRLLAGLAFGADYLQVVLLVAERHHPTTAWVLAAATLALALAGAAAAQRDAEGYDELALVLVALSLPLVLLAQWRLVHGDDDRGLVLLAFAGVYGLAAAGCFLRRPLRRLADPLAGYAAFCVALATATFLSNGGLAIAWTLEGVVLAAVAVRMQDRRPQAASLAFLAVALGHVIAFETPVTHLLREQPSPARHVGALAAVAVAIALAAVLAHGRRQLVAGLDLGLGAVAALLALYAVSLLVLDAVESLGSADLHTRFQRGELWVSILWVLVALAALSVGLARRVQPLRHAGLALLGLALAKLFLFDLAHLSSLARAGSALVVGLALLAGGFLVQRLAPPGAPTARSS